MIRGGSDEEFVDISLRLPRSTVEAAILAARHRPDGSREKAALARTIVVGRRRRRQIFLKVRFGEPSWDMILELYLSACEGQSVDVTSLCRACGVPQTTALRHLDMLERQGLVRREADIADGRRIFVRQCETLRLQLEHWLEREIVALDLGTT
jgi:DNA-binding MarR family transcriptional regulator